MVQKYKDLASVIKMQKESDDVYDRAMACVRSYLERPGTEKQQKIQEKLMKQRRKMEQQKKEELEKTIQSGGDTNFSFQVSYIYILVLVEAGEVKCIFKLSQ